MSRRIFTQAEIKQLLESKNITRCSEKAITYSNKFKLKAIKLYKQGFSPSDVFRQSGLDIRIIGRDHPHDCLKRWTKIYRAKGDKAFLTENRGKQSKGRPKKPKDLSDADKIRRLEAEVAYLKAENDFLAKLRAKRAERYSGRNRNTQ